MRWEELTFGVLCGLVISAFVAVFVLKYLRQTAEAEHIDPPPPNASITAYSNAGCAATLGPGYTMIQQTSEDGFVCTLVYVKKPGIKLTWKGI